MQHSRIKILDTQLANQIAAGEVVERPSSVVKELMENSFDANTKRIWVDIEQGGHELIRVRDDGIGIQKEDLSLALQRHATSKISSLDDLSQVSTLGFRGEALASIAAVSRLRLISQYISNEHAWCASSQEGEIKIEPAPHPQGTSVEVRDLFYNTPARRKFMRQPKTELSQILLIVQRLALSRFDLEICLNHNQKQLLKVLPAHSGSSQQQRVEAILGGEFSEKAFFIEFNAAGMSLKGWIASPQFTRSQPDSQYCYINGRFVKDKLFSQAIRQSYQDLLFGSRHPAYILYLDLDPLQLDVNVHPTKHEVRFRNSRLVFDFIKKALNSSLEQLRPGVSFHLPLKEPADRLNISDQVNSMLEEKTLLSNNMVDKTISIQKKLNFQVLDAPADYETVSSATEICYNTNLMESNTKTENLENTLGFALAQVKQTYLLAENDQGLVLVDMHAAHERILYEQLKLAYASKEIPRQQLLFPVKINLRLDEMMVWEQHQQNLEQSGILVEAMGPQALLIREIPALLPKLDPAELVKDIISALGKEEESRLSQECHQHLLATVACRAALHANHPLSLNEMNALLRQMEQTPHSGVCNHGRPTWVQLTVKDLDKFFFRGR